MLAGVFSERDVLTKVAANDIDMGRIDRRNVSRGIRDRGPQRTHARTTRRDTQEGPNTTTDEFWAVVAPNEFRHASDREYIDQQLDHFVASASSINLQCQALARVLVDQRKNLQRTTIAGPIEDEINRPDDLPLKVDPAL